MHYGYCLERTRRSDKHCCSLVYADGSICLDILQNRWSPTYDVSAILTSIQVSNNWLVSDIIVCICNYAALLFITFYSNIIRCFYPNSRIFPLGNSHSKYPVIIIIVYHAVMTSLCKGVASLHHNLLEKSLKWSCYSICQ